MPVNPSELKFFDYLAEESAKNPLKPFDERTIEEFREAGDLFNQFTGPYADVDYEDITIRARDGYAIPVRIFNSELTQISPILVMYPGCGYVGNLYKANAVACSRIAKYAGIKVALVYYRLTPEYPLPTPIYDGFDATKYLSINAERLSINPEKIIIGGLSSGAHCAAVISSLARNDQQLKISQQILINGVYDLAKTHSDYAEYEKYDQLMARAGLDYVVNNYWGINKQFKNPLFSPYHEDNLSQIPQTTIIVGEYDGLRSDSEAYYVQLKNAGVTVNKIVLTGQTHCPLIMREVMTDGDDPAQVIADVINQSL